MNKETPLLDREKLRAFLERSKDALLPVKASMEGRFILNVPDFGDGKGPILLPNIKELEAKMRGSEGEVHAIELEAGPQEIPADGTNLIVINRVDRFIQRALTEKLEYLIDGANGEFTRGVLEEFMGYARGYTYDAAKKTVTFSRNAGFHNDVYNMPVGEFKKKYVRHSRPDLSLEEVKDQNIRHGYYVKKPLPGYGAYLTGKFSVQVSENAGGTIQEFSHGAMVYLPEDPDLPISFIHATDINTCYTMVNGWPVVDSDGNDAMPRFDAARTQKADAASVLREKFPGDPTAGPK